MPILPELIDFAKNNPIDPVSLQPAIIDPGATIKDDGFPQQYVLPRQDINFLHNNSGQWNKIMQSVLKGHINGFRLISTLVSVPPADSHIKISHGTAMSDDELQFYDTQVETSIWGATEAQKNLFLAGSSSFVEGGGNPGLSSSLTFTNAVYYHTFIFVNASGDTDLGFDDDIQAANLIADHSITHPRRINSWLFNSAFGIRHQEQFGDFFYTADEAGGGGISITVASSNPAVFSIPSLVPTDVDVILLVSVEVVQTVPTTPASPTIAIASSLGNGTNTIIVPSTERNIGIYKILVQQSAPSIDVYHNITAGTLDILFKVIGWYDTRGRDWGSGSTSIPGQFFP